MEVLCEVYQSQSYSSSKIWGVTDTRARLFTYGTNRVVFGNFGLLWCRHDTGVGKVVRFPSMSAYYTRIETPCEFVLQFGRSMGKSIKFIGNKCIFDHWPFISGYIYPGTPSFDLPTQNAKLFFTANHDITPILSFWKRSDKYFDLWRRYNAPSTSKAWAEETLRTFWFPTIRIFLIDNHRGFHSIKIKNGKGDAFRIRGTHAVGILNLDRVYFCTD